MVRPRNLENMELPNRWRFTHGAYYYQVPPGMEEFWSGKKTYRLGTKYDQAIREFERMSAKMADPNQGNLDPTGIMELEDILAIGKRIPVAGVYFLMLNGELVYVGRSDSVLKRLSQHRANKLFFDQFHVIGCTDKDQKKLEQFYISKFRPRLNLMHL